MSLKKAPPLTLWTPNSLLIIFKSQAEWRLIDLRNFVWWGISVIINCGINLRILHLINFCYDISLAILFIIPGMSWFKKDLDLENWISKNRLLVLIIILVEIFKKYDHHYKIDDQ